MAVGSPNLKAFLVATPFFDGLSDESLDILASMLVERRFDAGATVVAEGEPGRFATTVPLEKVHPLQAGLFRLKTPSERRPDLPRETPLVFWAQYVREMLTKHVVLAGVIVRLIAMKLAIDRGANAKNCMDQALAPVDSEDDATRDLLTKTTGATAAVAHINKVALLTRMGSI